MPTSNYLMDKGYNAAAALTKLRAVKFSAAETVTPVTAITDQPCGIVQYGVTAGEITKGKGAIVRAHGDSMMEASAAVVIGALVSIGADGRGKTAATGERIIGVCVEAASGAGEYMRVQLRLPGTLAP